jgi:hypothetical protein
MLTVSVASAHGIDIFQISQSAPQSTYWGRVEIGECILYSVYALSAGAHTTTLYVMLDIVKEGERAPPLTSLSLFFHHDCMYARKWPLSL